MTRDGRATERMLAAVAVLVVAACAAGGDAPAPAPTVAGDEMLAAIDPQNVTYLTGAVSYRQRIALPKDATVVVDLYDLGASSGTLIAEKRFAAAGQVPIRFDLPYDRTRIVASQSYGVRARILVDGALWFLADEAVPVLTRGHPSSADILVRPARPSE